MATTLEIASPAFSKVMTKSNVVTTFWLNVPREFSTKHLTAGDQMVILQNSKGEVWQTKFLHNNSGFSAGWGQFAVHNQLETGDFLIFKLIRPQTFLVHVQRGRSCGETSQPNALRSSDSSQKEKSLRRKKPMTVVSPTIKRFPGLGRTAMEEGICTSSTKFGFRCVICGQRDHCLIECPKMYPGTVEEIFKDFKGRRAGMLKSLTSEVEDFFHLCDPKKVNLCLYGFPDEGWEVNLPILEDILMLPEPALGINFVRDATQREDWLLWVAVHSDAWLFAVSYFFGSRLHKNDREKLFDMINELPTLHDARHDVVNGEKPTTKETGINNSEGSITKSGGSKMCTVDVHPKPLKPSTAPPNGEKEHVDTYCGTCGGPFTTDEFCTGCHRCKEWSVL